MTFDLSELGLEFQTQKVAAHSKIDLTQSPKKLLRNFLMDEKISMYKRAKMDILNSTGEIIRQYREYISTQDERAYLRNLLETNEDNFCLYILMKIHHIFFIRYNVILCKIKGEFHKSYFFKWHLFSVLFIKVESTHTNNDWIKKELAKIQITP